MGYPPACLPVMSRTDRVLRAGRGGAPSQRAGGPRALRAAGAPLPFRGASTGSTGAPSPRSEGGESATTSPSATPRRIWSTLPSLNPGSTSTKRSRPSSTRATASLSPRATSAAAGTAHRVHHRERRGARLAQDGEVGGAPPVDVDDVRLDRVPFVNVDGGEHVDAHARDGEGAEEGDREAQRRDRAGPAQRQPDDPHDARPPPEAPGAPGRALSSNASGRRRPTPARRRRRAAAPPRAASSSSAGPRRRRRGPRRR
jgi:hypothetical protein